jgi:hypothetical protein
MWSNPQSFDPLIDMKYDVVMTDWQLLRQQYTPPNDSNLAKIPGAGSYSDSEPLQNRCNSILSLDSHMDLVGGQSSAKSQGNPNEKKHKSPPLACPFYRGNPWKYYTCQKYDLQRIKDVKQHINRRHVKPDFYCARCYEVFVDATSRDAHARELICDIRGYPEFDGITDSQRGELKESHKRGKGIAEQWYYIWDILFRGQPQPKSPYIGNYREEMGPLIRDFWNNKRLKIISNTPPRLSQGVFDQVMDIVLNHYESESANTIASMELRQKNCTQIPYEMLESADTAIPAQIGVSEAAQHVTYSCLWQCCVCWGHAGIDVYATPACPSCQHYRCDTCRVEKVKLPQPPLDVCTLFYHAQQPREPS